MIIIPTMKFCWKIKEIAKNNSNLIHVVPERKDLGIGGCWNEAVHNKLCGRFSIQLDSDDIYPDENTVQTVVNTFRRKMCHGNWYTE